MDWDGDLVLCGSIMSPVAHDQCPLDVLRLATYRPGTPPGPLAVMGWDGDLVTTPLGQLCTTLLVIGASCCLRLTTGLTIASLQLIKTNIKFNHAQSAEKLIKQRNKLLAKYILQVDILQILVKLSINKYSKYILNNVNNTNI